MKRNGFTLAEVLITLAIIGVVAAISIPSVVANTQQKEFQTGLRKAVSVLNSAITMNMAIDGESPYENKNLFEYLQRHMSIIESTTDMKGKYWVGTNKRPEGTVTAGNIWTNSAFYTTDGMRFEFLHGVSPCGYGPKLHENPDVNIGMGTSGYGDSCDFQGCGSYGLNSNPDNTTKPPCHIIVDVNGDRKPSPSNVDCKSTACANRNIYKLSDIQGKKLTDIFSILITDTKAIPFGVAAQRAMYQAQKAN